MKNHPAMLRAAWKSGAEWAWRPRPIYCGGCGVRLENTSGVVHIGHIERCADCHERTADKRAHSPGRKAA